MTPEGKIKKEIVKNLENMGWFVMNIYTGGRFSTGSRGSADLYVLKNGRGVWLEVKTPKNKQQPEQIVFESEIKLHGGEYYVVRSLDDVVNFLNGNIN
ncbi:MAG: VRR-NUC domain-containing protein [Nitrospirota bacterium]